MHYFRALLLAALALCAGTQVLAQAPQAITRPMLVAQDSINSADTA